MVGVCCDPSDGQCASSASRTASALLMNFRQRHSVPGRNSPWRIGFPLTQYSGCCSRRAFITVQPICCGVNTFYYGASRGMVRVG